MITHTLTQDKASYAYDKIKKDIVMGKLNSDIPLSEAYFVKMLGISRTPIRASLQRLQQEGFIRIIPKQGIVINELSLEEALQLFELNFIVEHFLIFNSVAYLTEADYKQLAEMIEEQKKAADERRYYDYLEIDQKFHMFFYHYHDNKFMIDIMNNFRERFYFWRYNTLTKPGRIEESIKEHETILKLFQKKDYESAYKLMVDHMQQVRGAIESNFMSIKNI